MPPTTLPYALARLKSSRSLETKRQRLQRTSRALETKSYTSLHPQHVSRAPDLHTSTPPRLRACSASPELLRQSPTRPYTRSTPPSPYLHVCTPTAHLPSPRSLEANSSASTRLQPASRASCLYASTSARIQRISRPLVYQGPQHASRAPDLLRQTPPRPAPAACLTSFRPLHLHVDTLAAGLPSSRASYPYVTTSAGLQPLSIPPYLLISTPIACLRSSTTSSSIRTTSTSISSRNWITGKSWITDRSWITGWS